MHRLMISILSLQSGWRDFKTDLRRGGCSVRSYGETRRLWDAVLVVRKRKPGFLVLDLGAQSGVGCILSTQYLCGKRIEWNVATNKVPDIATSTK